MKSNTKQTKWVKHSGILDARKKFVGNEFLVLCLQVNRPEILKYKHTNKGTEVHYTVALL